MIGLVCGFFWGLFFLDVLLSAFDLQLVFGVCSVGGFLGVFVVSVVCFLGCLFF